MARFGNAALAAVIFSAALAVSQSRPALQQAFDVLAPVSVGPALMPGRLELVYELHLTNFASRNLTIERIVVTDADSREPYLTLEGTKLTAAMAKPDAVVPPGARATVYLTVAAQPSAQAVVHTIEVRETGPIVAGTVRVARSAAQGLGPPLRGGPWAAVYNHSWERGHRRVFSAVNGRARIPGRFAIDWMKVDEKGAFASGDAAQLSNWFGYGEDVLAVADAVVAAAESDIAEPAVIASGDSAKVPIQDASGCYVSLDLGGGRFAFYEHLKPGSLKVRKGQRVKRGDVIAAVGYTGQSTGPHLHFHLAGGNSTLDAEGVPYFFEAFSQIGLWPLVAFTDGKAWVRSQTPSTRRGEFPEALAVIRFP